MFSINQTADGWEVLGADGTRLGELHDTYALALAAIAGEVRAHLADAGEDDPEAGDAGLLPERWTDVAGICFSTATGDGRNFAECDWTWRDPAVSTLPLMLQTTTEMGHFGAVLAGYMEELSIDGGTPHSSGRFYDTEQGRQLRDMLLNDRTFGVSVDPGRYDVSWVCKEEDEDGWCTDEEMVFSAYEIIGLTATPFPAFAEARIGLVGATASSAPSAVLLQTGNLDQRFAPDNPPDEWLAMAEPELGSELLVEQDEEGNVAVPLTITDDGQLFGNLAYWGQCHTGWEGVCVQPPASASHYARYHLGETVLDSGERLATGPFVVGCDHAELGMFAGEALDHYAHTGLHWASVRVSDGTFGPWFAGAVDPQITRDQLSVLRASCMSGDWRRLGGSLELIMGLSVNNPGFPILREAITASGLGQVPRVRAQAGYAGGIQQALVASSIVRPVGCTTCGDHGEAGNLGKQLVQTAPSAPDVRELARTLAIIERRTRHLAPAAAAAAQERLATV